MIVNYNLFIPGFVPEKGLLTILEQIPYVYSHRFYYATTLLHNFNEKLLKARLLLMQNTLYNKHGL